MQEKLKAATTPEAVGEIAKDAGFAITAEDIQSMQSQSGEVSDEELENAAGGAAPKVSFASLVQFLMGMGGAANICC